MVEPGVEVSVGIVRDDNFGPLVIVAALAQVIVGFAELASELGEVLDAVEANPVIASPAGAIAVDALVIARGQKIE
jgi:hypothetical protein